MDQWNGIGMFPREVVQKRPGGFCQTRSLCCRWKRRVALTICPCMRTLSNKLGDSECCQDMT